MNVSILNMIAIGFSGFVAGATHGWFRALNLGFMIFNMVIVYGALGGIFR